MLSQQPCSALTAGFAGLCGFRPTRMGVGRQVARQIGVRCKCDSHLCSKASREPQDRVLLQTLHRTNRVEHDKRSPVPP